MLKPYVIKRTMIGVVIRKLQDIWLDKNFKVSEKELLEEVPQIVNEIEDVQKLRK